MLQINPLVYPQYYTTLFNTFKGLLSEQEIAILDEQIKLFEEWLSDDLNPLTLQEAEMRMYQNNDLLSGFEVRGTFITQMEINQKLEQIRQWLIRVFYMKARDIRFTQQIPIE
jgi:hypothetical protein